VKKDKTYLLKQNIDLFNATLDEFSNNSYQTASTNRIIMNSDYNKGSFYYRFKTKEDIYFALIDDLYTTQLTIYNSKNIRLRNLNNTQDIIELIFNNTKDLYNNDKRYFKLLRKVNSEDSILKTYIRTSCIQSLFERITMRIQDIYKADDIDLLIDTLFNLALNHFNYSDSLNYNSNLTRIIDFLVKDKVTYNMEEVNEFKLEIFKSRTNFIVSKPSSLVFDSKFRLSLQISDKQATIMKIKDKLKIKQVTLTNVINAGIKKNLIDLSYLLSLQALDFSDTSYHKLSYIQKIILILVYNTFIGQNYQVLDNLLSNVGYKDLQLLFIQLLPKIAKISTIVIVEDFIYPNLVSDYDIFHNHNSKVKKIKLDNLSLKTSKIEVNYYEDNYLKTKDFKSYNKSFSEILQNKKVTSVTHKTKLSFEDIIDYKE